jgi:hypothetical protein
MFALIVDALSHSVDGSDAHFSQESMLRDSSVMFGETS